MSNTSVATEPIPVEYSKEQLELNNLKSTILSMLDQTLSIRNYGTGYKHDNISVKIDGQEMFVEALLDFLSQKENNKAISYLEDLKYTNKDWKSIDDKISQVVNENNNLKFLSENNIHLEKVKDFLDEKLNSQQGKEHLRKEFQCLDSRPFKN